MPNAPWPFNVFMVLGVLVYIVLIVAPIGIWISVRGMAKQMRAQTALLAADVSDPRLLRGGDSGGGPATNEVTPPLRARTVDLGDTLPR